MCTSRTARDSAYSVEKAPDEISATGGHRLLSPRPTGPSVDPVYTTLRRGSKGDAVRECQGILARLGYDLGRCGIDGDFGKCTEAAVRKYQKERGLTVDGIVGPKTCAAILRERKR